MANVEFDDIEGGNAAMTSGRFGRAINLAGAACSVGLIVGLAVWGYKLAVRDVSGIPVVRALEGPLRIAPENPGGAVTLNQGLSVNAVAAAGTALPLTSPTSASVTPFGSFVLRSLAKKSPRPTTRFQFAASNSAQSPSNVYRFSSPHFEKEC